MRWYALQACHIKHTTTESSSVFVGTCTPVVQASEQLLLGRRQVWAWLCAGLALLLVWLAWRVWSGRHRPVSLRHPAGQPMPSPASSPGQACDIFICHRGPDVKGDLVGHIEERLKRANLIVFVDYGMPKGVVGSWAHVLATLRGARGVLILLTPGFEESPWCLEEARAVAARLSEPRAAGAAQVAVLPVFIDRRDKWDEETLPAALNEFAADRDFDQLREEEPQTAANILAHWRSALDPVARVGYLKHSFKPPRFVFASSYPSAAFLR